MKKSFVYLVAVLMLALMLCACGMNTDDGVIATSPKPSDAVDTIPSIIPDVSPTVIPDDKIVKESAAPTSNPQVGVTETAKPDTAKSDSKNR